MLKNNKKVKVNHSPEVQFSNEEFQLLHDRVVDIALTHGTGKLKKEILDIVALLSYKALSLEEASC